MDERDMKDSTDEALGLNKTMDKAYPKFQYSIFLRDREEQLVIRAETWKEFLDAKRDADLIISKRASEAKIPGQPEPVKEQAKEDLGHCHKCGAPMIHNPKTGKNFCKDKCWLKGQL